MQHTSIHTLTGRLIKKLIEYRSRRTPVFLCAHSYVCVSVSVWWMGSCREDPSPAISLNSLNKCVCARVCAWRWGVDRLTRSPPIKLCLEGKRQNKWDYSDKFTELQFWLRKMWERGDHYDGNENKMKTECVNGWKYAWVCKIVLVSISICGWEGCTCRRWRKWGHLWAKREKHD